MKSLNLLVNRNLKLMQQRYITYNDQIQKNYKSAIIPGILGKLIFRNPVVMYHSVILSIQMPYDSKLLLLYQCPREIFSQAHNRTQIREFVTVFL